MEEKSIVTISPEEILKANSGKFDIQYRGCYIASLEKYAEYNSGSLLEYPCRINAFFLLICKQGRGTISINLTDHEIRENTIFINQPNNILHIPKQEEKGPVRSGVMIGFDQEMPREVNFDIKQFLPLALKLKDTPVINISEEECDELLHIVKHLGTEILEAQEEPFQNEVIRSYFQLFFFKLCRAMSRALNAQPLPETSVKSRNEEYFQRFMQVLSENYRRERSLGFYASQLCITPKYLTTLIKKVSGRSASEWIDQYVTLEAKNLLRYSTMSIQEVAYHLNFANQSFFGKYFKHQTGYSPSAYKMLK